MNGEGLRIPSNDEGLSLEHGPELVGVSATRQGLEARSGAVFQKCQAPRLGILLIHIDGQEHLCSIAKIGRACQFHAAFPERGDGGGNTGRHKLTATGGFLGASCRGAFNDAGFERHQLRRAGLQSSQPRMVTAWLLCMR